MFDPNALKPLEDHTDKWLDKLKGSGSSALILIAVLTTAFGLYFIL